MCVSVGVICHEREHKCQNTKFNLSNVHQCSSLRGTGSQCRKIKRGRFPTTSVFSSLVKQAAFAKVTDCQQHQEGHEDERQQDAHQETNSAAHKLAVMCQHAPYCFHTKKDQSPGAVKNDDDSLVFGELVCGLVARDLRAAEPVFVRAAAVLVVRVPPLRAVEAVVPLAVLVHVAPTVLSCS